MIKLIMILGCASFFSAAFAAPAAKKEDPTANTTIEGYLQGFSTIPGFISLRDPFLEVDPPYKSKLEQAVGKEAETLGPLEKYPVSSYKLVAVLLNDERPRALVRVPAEGGGAGGKLLIVRLKDKLGNRGGIITRMDEYRIYVTETSYARRKNTTESKQTMLKLNGKVEYK